MEKKCSTCKEVKNIGDFHNSKNRKDGKVSICKVCACYKTKKWASEQPADYVKNSKKRYNDKNREYVNSYARTLYQRNKPKFHAKSKKYSFLKKKSCPKWLTKEQHSDITKMYALAKKFSAIFGVKYHVDHIVPLNGENVCGLHVPWNLQILEAKLNLRKSNILKEK